ncbi:MAG: cytochrome c [Ilumatobacter sp.]|jgi:cytochrome c
MNSIVSPASIVMSAMAWNQQSTIPILAERDAVLELAASLDPQAQKTTREGLGCDWYSSLHVVTA